MSISSRIFAFDTECHAFQGIPYMAASASELGKDSNNDLLLFEDLKRQEGEVMQQFMQLESQRKYLWKIMKPLIAGFSRSLRKNLKTLSCGNSYHHNIVEILEEVIAESTFPVSEHKGNDSDTEATSDEAVEGTVSLLYTDYGRL
jgi:hypothetical protein